MWEESQVLKNEAHLAVRRLYVDLLNHRGHRETQRARTRKAEEISQETLRKKGRNRRRQIKTCLPLISTVALI